MSTTKIEILPAMWCDKKITAEITSIRYINGEQGLTAAICLDLSWDGKFGGRLKGKEVPILITEGEELQIETFQLVVKGRNLIDPEISLRPYIDGKLSETTYKARSFREDPGIDCLDIWHHNGRLTVNLKNCPGSRNIFVERRTSQNGKEPVELIMLGSDGRQRFPYKLRAATARALGEALIFAAEQQ